MKKAVLLKSFFVLGMVSSLAGLNAFGASSLTRTDIYKMRFENLDNLARRSHFATERQKVTDEVEQKKLMRAEGISRDIDLSKLYLEKFPEANYYKNELIPAIDEEIELLKKGPNHYVEFISFMIDKEGYVGGDREFWQKMSDKWSGLSTRTRGKAMKGMIAKLEKKKASFQKMGDQFQIAYSPNSLASDLEYLKRKLEGEVKKRDMGLSWSYGNMGAFPKIERDCPSIVSDSVQRACFALRGLEGLAKKYDKTLIQEEKDRIRKYKELYDVAEKAFKEKDEVVAEGLEKLVKQEKALDEEVDKSFSERAKKVHSSSRSKVDPFARIDTRSIQLAPEFSMALRAAKDKNLIQGMYVDSRPSLMLALQDSKSKIAKLKNFGRALVGKSDQYVKTSNGNLNLKSDPDNLSLKQKKFLVEVMNSCLKNREGEESVFADSIDREKCLKALDSKNEKLYGKKALRSFELELAKVVAEDKAKRVGKNVVDAGKRVSHEIVAMKKLIEAKMPMIKNSLGIYDARCVFEKEGQLNQYLKKGGYLKREMPKVPRKFEPHPPAMPRAVYMAQKESLSKTRPALPSIGISQGKPLPPTPIKYNKPLPKAPNKKSGELW